MFLESGIFWFRYLESALLLITVQAGEQIVYVLLITAENYI